LQVFKVVRGLKPSWFSQLMLWNLNAGALQLFAPKIYDYYKTVLGALFSSDQSLKWNFRNSIFPCVTINFGPRTVCYPHIDFANLAWGWCAITSLGRFNPDLGGHLVLWDLNLVVRFPPGSTILIPSALFHHSNVQIQFVKQDTPSHNMPLQDYFVG
jgi:hypothetical protein